MKSPCPVYILHPHIYEVFWVRNEFDMCATNKQKVSIDKLRPLLTKASLPFINSDHSKSTWSLKHKFEHTILL